MSDSNIFVPNGTSRRETAILLVGTADEHNIDQRTIKATSGGFFITRDLAELVDVPVLPADDEDGDLYDPSDYTIDQVKDFVTEHPDLAADIQAAEQEGKNRSTLVDWLEQFVSSDEDDETSGDRAAKNNS